MPSGFENEDNIREALHNQTFSALNSNLQQLIKNSFKNYNNTILCTKQAGQNKSDLMITIGTESHTYSIKKGTGNSIHQEPIEPFLLFLDANYSISPQIKDSLRLFIWGDKTLDGTGLVSDRLSVSEFKKKYPQDIIDIQSFFDTITEPLIKRFLIDGVQSNSSAEFIYYGNETSGTCISSIKALKWIVNNKSNGAISIGKFTFQAWNRNITDTVASKNKRGVIQLKWASIINDIKII